MDRTQQSRAFYRPSGHVNWLKFLPGLLASAGVAIAMAWCLFWALQRGFYLIFFAPLIAALPVAGLWYLVLTWSHCRNKGIAAVISVILGSVLYLGILRDRLAGRGRCTQRPSDRFAAALCAVPDENRWGSRCASPHCRWRCPTGTQQGSTGAQLVLLWRRAHHGDRRTGQRRTVLHHKGVL